MKELIRLTSLKDMFYSLIEKFANEELLVFDVYPKERHPDLLIDFHTYPSKYEFQIWKLTRKNELLVYYNGDVYMIKNFLSENYVDEFDDLFNEFTYYTTIFYAYVDTVDSPETSGFLYPVKKYLLKKRYDNFKNKEKEEEGDNKII